MKLYFSPGACSLSVHIALCEAGLNFELEKVDLKTHRTASDKDYYTINRKGYVPALELADGAIITEGAAIVQFVADQAPASKLAPAPGSFERVRLQEWLNYIACELHESYGPLWHHEAPAETRQSAKDKIEKQFAWLDSELSKRPYLMGEQFTVADGYLFTVANWHHFLKLSLDAWPSLKAFMARVAARPAVIAALKAEGLHG